MHVYLKQIIEYFFPLRDDARIIIQIRIEDVPTLYNPHIYEETTALSSFKVAQVRALIHEAKFHESGHACKLLGTLLAHHLSERPHTFDMAIPVPLSRERIRARGHNQVASVLKYAKLPFRTDTHLLMRVRNTQPQTNLTRADRIRNLSNAFLASKPEQIRGKRVLLIDDVVTTGATLMAAKQELLKHDPASVHCIALAH